MLRDVVDFLCYEGPMITDIFARRYADIQIRSQYCQDDLRFMTQASKMLMDPLWLGHASNKVSDTTEANLKGVHDTLAMELGRDFLSDRFWFHKYTMNGNEFSNAHTNSYASICKTFLIRVPSDLSQSDVWVKERLSLVELAFRMRALQIQQANAALPAIIAAADAEDSKPRPYGRGIRIPGQRSDGLRASNHRMNAAFEEQVSDLNERMRLALYKLTYHNGFIQLGEDGAIDAQIAKPFWALVANAKWANVDEQIKEAIDRRDNGDRTAAFV